jgi:VIT1/CCC1 family predicted Fe2+/Mn2+ transporter
MQVEKGFIAGFLVLGFAIFIFGFLTGLYSIAVIPATADAASLGILAFAVGVLLGALLVAMILTIIRFNEMAKAARPQADSTVT